MATRLEHRQIYALMSAVSEAKIVNLDSSIRNLLNPIAESLGRTGVGAEVGFHILCCDEYALVTGVTGGSLVEVERAAETIRSALAQAQKT